MIREQMLGKLSELERKYKEQDMLAASALTMIVLKADAYEQDFTRLETALLKTNADALHRYCEEMRSLKQQINVLKTELGL